MQIVSRQGAPITPKIEPPAKTATEVQVAMATMKRAEPVISQDTPDEFKNFVPPMLENYIQRDIDTDLEEWIKIKPITLVGESGSGKNFAVRHYAAVHKLPLLIVPCDDGQVLKELLGYWRVFAGATVWEEGLLSRFMRIPSVILFDEVNCLPAGKLFMLHELLENRKLFVKDAPTEKSIVNVNPETRLFLAMNPPEARYSGTNRLNVALTTRVAVIEIPPFTGQELLTESTGKVELDKQVVFFYDEVSKLIRTQKLRLTICKRHIDAIVKAIKAGITLDKAIGYGFINSAILTASGVEKKVLEEKAIMIFGASNVTTLVMKLKNSAND